MGRHPRRNQPARPYQSPSPRRIIMECKRRLWPMRGPRAYEAIAVLVDLFPKAQSGIVFKGDCCAKHKSDHCCMAVLMKRCGKTAHRAKYDLLRIGAIRLHGAGPGQKAGGSVLNSFGQLVAAATGYELDPALLVQRRDGTRPPKRERAITTGSHVESPAERHLREENVARMQTTLAQLRSRAGPERA